MFVSPGAPTRNFALGPGSAAIDAGTFLTTTVGAGTSSTTLIVADAGYFHDGFGLGPQVPGDTIQVGSQSPVLITEVNYATNTLTLQTGISWANGQPVSLVYTGSAPDMGALEAEGSDALPAPTNFRVLSLTP